MKPSPGVLNRPLSTYPQPVLIRIRILPPSGQISSVRSRYYPATHTSVARAFQPEHLPERFWPPAWLLPTESVPCTHPLIATKTPPNSPRKPSRHRKALRAHHPPARTLAPADFRPRLACGTAVHRTKTQQHSHPRTPVRGSPVANGSPKISPAKIQPASRERPTQSTQRLSG